MLFWVLLNGRLGPQSSRLAEAVVTAADEERREREELGLDLEEERSELPPIPESPAASEEGEPTEVASLSVRQRMSAEGVEAHLRSLLVQVRSTARYREIDGWG